MARRASFLSALSIIVLVVSLVLGTGAFAARGPGLVRDTEIENTIRAFAAPLLDVAGLDPEAFRVHLMRSPQINAFVAGGQRLFITTGLLRRSKDAGEVIGVIAHEIGHIAGGHLVQRQGVMDDASMGAMIAQILGVAVGVLSGNPGAGAAVGAGGLQVIQRKFLRFSRSQEQAADQAAVRFLDAAGLSSRGLSELLETLAGQELLQASIQDPYLLTHPLTRDRLIFVRNHIANSPYSDAPLPARFVAMHRRMVAKLDGFLDPPGTTLRRYRAGDASLPAQYARAIAYYREPDLKAALPLIDKLIAAHPRDPYFRELKGQMLFENGRVAEALPSYQKAVGLMPEAALLRTGLAHVQLELNRPDLLDSTIANLKQALRTDRFDAAAWRLSAMAYGRKGELGLSAWSLAEYNILIGRKKDAQAQARRAMRLLKRGSSAWLRAQDILQQARQRS